MNLVEWDDQELADAFIERCGSQGVMVSPETAMQLAQDVRSKSTKNDMLELTAIIKDVMDELSFSPEETVVADVNDIMTVVATRFKSFLKKLAARDISQEEETELRNGLLSHVIIPSQEGVANKIAAATRKVVAKLAELYTKINQIEEWLDKNDEEMDRLYEAKTTEENKTKKRKAKVEYGHKLAMRRKKVHIALKWLTEINMLRSKLIIFDTTRNYVNRNLVVPDQFRGLDGYSSYFEGTLLPVIKNVKKFIGEVQRNVILPEVTEKTKHKRDWLMRHHSTKSFQDARIGPDVTSISLEDLKQSPTYEEMRKAGISDEKIEGSLEKLNALPDTWRKGHAIYMLLDPPNKDFWRQGVGTLVRDTQDYGEWGPELKTMQPFDIEKGKMDDPKTNFERTTKPRAYSPDRKLAEAKNPNAHWVVLLNFTRNQKVDKSGKTRGEKYVEDIVQDYVDKKVFDSLKSVPDAEKYTPETASKVEKLKKIHSRKSPEALDKIIIEALADIKNSNKYNEETLGKIAEIQKTASEEANALKSQDHVIDRAAKLDNEDMMHDRDVINNAMFNEGTPSWVLMRAAVTGYASELRRIAKAILESRGYVLATNSAGKPLMDPETKSPVWKKQGESTEASISSRTLFAQVGQAEVQKQQIGQEISALDNQIQQAQIQMDNLRQKQNDVSQDNRSEDQINQERQNAQNQIDNLQGQIKQYQSQKEMAKQRQDSIPVPADGVDNPQKNMAQPTLPVAPVAPAGQMPGPIMSSLSSRDI